LTPFLISACTRCSFCLPLHRRTTNRSYYEEDGHMQIKALQYLFPPLDELGSSSFIVLFWLIHEGE